MDLLTLRADKLHLQLAPHIGGSIARFYSKHHGQPTHWFRPATDDALVRQDITAMASFPMVPYCGRIRDRQFQTPQGDTVRLPVLNGLQHALHGIGWLRPWTVVQQTEDSAHLRLVVDAADWPYPFQADQSFTLTDTGLTQTLTLTHHGSTPMPYGLGFHPYFCRTQDARVTLNSAGHWLSDQAVLPLRPSDDHFLSNTLAGVFDPAQHVLDNTFFGWQHTATVTLGTHAITLKSSAPADFFAIYTPENEDYFCLEPCTHVPDFPNLTAFDAALTGGHWLNQDEQLSITCVYDVSEAL
ncbi:aldose epimerase family protein [Leeia oryzae]|uniref:aldose epimerase family protein n=1 Tax=Leeia oryzae TaxID=356662 RepID=UPI00037E5896|nr:hypothetical protein [Leeia oryzae]